MFRQCQTKLIAQTIDELFTDQFVGDFVTQQTFFRKQHRAPPHPAVSSLPWFLVQFALPFQPLDHFRRHGARYICAHKPVLGVEFATFLGQGVFDRVFRVGEFDGGLLLPAFVLCRQTFGVVVHSHAHGAPVLDGASGAWVSLRDGSHRVGDATWKKVGRQRKQRGSKKEAKRRPSQCMCVCVCCVLCVCQH